MTESICSTMNVRSPKLWDTKHGITQYFRFTVDMFFICSMCVCLEKLLYWLFVYTNESNRLFSPIKFCDESGLAILNRLLWIFYRHIMANLMWMVLKKIARILACIKNIFVISKHLHHRPPLFISFCKYIWQLWPFCLNSAKVL